ncbi:MAG: hypothetical protein GY909_15890 [Oligoflexia bacterium]|nr:hypothetical protein [Oligoflexia bacterium]
MKKLILSFLLIISSHLYAKTFSASGKVFCPILKHRGTVEGSIRANEQMIPCPYTKVVLRDSWRPWRRCAQGYSDRNGNFRLKGNCSKYAKKYVSVYPESFYTKVKAYRVGISRDIIKWKSKKIRQKRGHLNFGSIYMGRSSEKSKFRSVAHIHAQAALSISFFRESLGLKPKRTIRINYNRHFTKWPHAHYTNIDMPKVTNFNDSNELHKLYSVTHEIGHIIENHMGFKSLYRYLRFYHSDGFQQGKEVEKRNGTHFPGLVTTKEFAFREGFATFLDHLFKQYTGRSDESFYYVNPDNGLKDEGNVAYLLSVATLGNRDLGLRGVSKRGLLREILKDNSWQNLQNTFKRVCNYYDSRNVASFCDRYGVREIIFNH